MFITEKYEQRVTLHSKWNFFRIIGWIIEVVCVAEIKDKLDRRKNIYHAYLSDFAAVSSAEASSPTDIFWSSTNPAFDASASGKKSAVCEDWLSFNDLRKTWL